MGQESKTRDRVYRAASASLFIYSASAIALPICLVRISGELGFNLTQGGALGFITSILQFFVLFASSFAAAPSGRSGCSARAFLSWPWGWRSSL